MSTDTRNFLAALLDHWPVTIFLPAIVLMLLGFIVVTILWDRHDHRTAAETAEPGRLDGDPATSSTEAMPVVASRHRSP